MTREGSAVAAAEALLGVAATADEVPAQLVDALVEAVGEMPLVALHRRASVEGPHRLTHALRLAMAVVDAARAPREGEKEGVL